jgi:hypothetical protein
VVASSQTLLTPPAAVCDPRNGHIVGRLFDGNSQPLVGQTVSLMAVLTKDLRIPPPGRRWRRATSPSRQPQHRRDCVGTTDGWTTTAADGGDDANLGASAGAWS